MPIENRRWWLISSNELSPASLFTDDDTINELVASIPGLTAEPISKPVLSDAADESVQFPASI